MPSEARTCGEFRILVLLSLRTACNSTPGSVVEKSAEDKWPSRSKLTEPVEVLVPLLVVVVVPRGVKLMAELRPALRPDAPVDAKLAARSRVCVEFASMIR